MIHQVARALKRKELKLLPVDNQLEKEIKDLASVMKTNPIDVVATAIDILKKSVGRKVTIQKSDSNVAMELKTLEGFDTLVDFENKK